MLGNAMPKGLTQTSSLIVIGARVAESALNTFTQGRVDLQLNPLDNEVFVVQAIDLNVANPDAQAGVNTSVSGALTTTTQTALPGLQDSPTMAVKEMSIRAAGFVDGGVAFESASMESPPGGLDYIGIIATNDFFLQIQGSGNLGGKAIVAKVYGYRAKAASSIYAALVQSELLSS
tara:strand:+ start:46 stop:573 length:528 start_codon:yes stop_codon:yes gene_type:complete